MTGMLVGMTGTEGVGMAVEELYILLVVRIQDMDMSGWEVRTYQALQRVMVVVIRGRVMV
jgi:hypothetical protein